MLLGLRFLLLRWLLSGLLFLFPHTSLSFLPSLCTLILYLLPYCWFGLMSLGESGWCGGVCFGRILVFLLHNDFHGTLPRQIGCFWCFFWLGNLWSWSYHRDILRDQLLIFGKVLQQGICFLIPLSLLRRLISTTRRILRPLTPLTTLHSLGAISSALTKPSLVSFCISLFLLLRLQNHLLKSLRLEFVQSLIVVLPGV